MKKAKGKMAAGRITKPGPVSKNNKPDDDAPKPPMKKGKR